MKEKRTIVSWEDAVKRKNSKLLFSLTNDPSKSLKNPSVSSPIFPRKSMWKFLLFIHCAFPHFFSEALNARFDEKITQPSIEN